MTTVTPLPQLTTPSVSEQIIDQIMMGGSCSTQRRSRSRLSNSRDGRRRRGESGFRKSRSRIGRFCGGDDVSRCICSFSDTQLIINNSSVLHRVIFRTIQMMEAVLVLEKQSALPVIRWMWRLVFPCLIYVLIV